MAGQGSAQRLLDKFINEIETEEGVTKKIKRKTTGAERARQNTKVVLRAAGKGQVELPDDESYLGKPMPKSRINVNRVAREGYSLIEQTRNNKPADLAERNLRYLRHVQKRAMKNADLAEQMMAKESAAAIARQEREKITGQREKKKRTTPKDKSVFSEKDFAVFKKKEMKPIDLEDMW
ncbi:unnamed protein product, partial [Mesorhabditis belari]|uniref:Active regulator of SIRT1 n=1 Tax=Mesorhabditis belari TaxID=2138241 RepID=A0AAF3JBY4_9BILA